MSAAPGPVRRILVVRLRRLGDLLLCTPAIRAVREAHPDARLDVLAAAPHHVALENDPDLDRLLVLGPGARAWLRTLGELRRARYDLVVDLQSSPRTLPLVVATGAPMRLGWAKRPIRDWAYHRLAEGYRDRTYWGRKMLRVPALAGIPAPSDPDPRLTPTAADRERAAALLGGAGLDPERPLVALSAVVRDDLPRRWAPERFARVADGLVERAGAQVVLTHGPGELAQVRQVVECMRATPLLWDYPDGTLHELGALVERCDLWIGNDGGPKHVAVAVGTRTVVLIVCRAMRRYNDFDDLERQAAAHPPEGSERRDDVQAVEPDDVLALALDRLEGWRGRRARVG